MKALSGLLHLHPAARPNRPPGVGGLHRVKGGGPACLLPSSLLPSPLALASPAWQRLSQRQGGVRAMAGEAVPGEGEARKRAGTVSRDDVRLAKKNLELGAAGSLLDNVSVVMCQPQGASNLGSVCRLMQNFGLKDLSVINPGPFVYNESWKKEDGSQDYSPEVAAEWLLETTLPPQQDIDEVLKDCTFVLGTTARSRTNMPVLSVREAAQVVAKEAQRGKVAILFGNERHGLTSEELKWANACVAIRMAPPPEEAGKVVAPSLNLSSAAAIILSEVFEAADSVAVAACNNVAGDLMSVRMKNELVKPKLPAGMEYTPVGSVERSRAEIKRQQVQQQLQRVFSTGEIYTRDIKPVFAMARAVISGERKIFGEERGGGGGGGEASAAAVTVTHKEADPSDPNSVGYFETDPTEGGKKTTTFVSYRWVTTPAGEVAMSMESTFSPPSMRGRGLAAVVVRAACDHAGYKGAKIIPSCSYISGAFLRKNPQYQGLVVA